MTSILRRRFLLQDPRTNRTTYKIRVKTSDRPGAGTDANVYIDLRGEMGATGECTDSSSWSSITHTCVVRAPLQHTHVQ